MALFTHPAFDGHELVALCHDPQTNLRAIIALHSTLAGPAVGGVRFWPYGSEDEALRDVLRLSQGMTYKNILAGLPHGGGKSVILGSPRQDKSPALLRAFARKVEALGGRYIAAEDVGTSVADMEIMASETAHVAGRTGPGGSGDPSPMTALGVFLGLKAAVAERLGRHDLSGLRVAVQGLGHVGWSLCQHLHQAGARLVVADIEAVRVQRAVESFGAEAAPAVALHAQPVEVFAPCALGGILNQRSIPDLQAAVVAGSANNQLETPEDGARLAARGILYAPDYVINAGGVINVAAEVGGAYDPARVRAKVEGIATTLQEIFRRAAREKLPPAEVADALAREKLQALSPPAPLGFPQRAALVS